MATSKSDSFIPPNKECKLLQKYFGILLHTITDPVTLAADLYSAGLVSESTRRKATTENNDCNSRNCYLLDELMIAVANDCTKLAKIISVLESYPPLVSAIAEEMKIEYSRGKKMTIL